jgi:hypothetical protein
MRTSDIKDNMRIMVYNLEGCGTVTHIIANNEIVTADKDADWLLQQYQDIKLPFKRYPLKSHVGNLSPIKN